MQKHKFVIGNPCGPCEWHIEADVRIFAWFDFIYQLVFVVPVILQFKIFISTAEKPTNQKIISTTSQSSISSTSAAYAECNEDINLALQYSICDIANLSIGMITDLILYAGAKNVGGDVCAKTCIWIFLIGCIMREAMHIAGTAIHVMRCMPESYPYEFVVRVLSQYLLYGIWIVIEYLIWINKGRLFVPRRGQMEPPEIPITVFDDDSRLTSGLSSQTGLTTQLTSEQQSSIFKPETSGMINSQSVSETAQNAGDNFNSPTRRRKSKRKSKRKTLPADAEVKAEEETGEGEVPNIVVTPEPVQKNKNSPQTQSKAPKK